MTFMNISNITPSHLKLYINGFNRKGYAPHISLEDRDVSDLVERAQQLIKKLSKLSLEEPGLGNTSPNHYWKDTALALDGKMLSRAGHSTGFRTSQLKEGYAYASSKSKTLIICVDILSNPPPQYRRPDDTDNYHPSIPRDNRGCVLYLQSSPTLENINAYEEEVVRVWTWKVASIALNGWGWRDVYELDLGIGDKYRFLNWTVDPFDEVKR